MKGMTFVEQGHRRFREGKKSVEDDQFSGRPQTACAAENIERVPAALLPLQHGGTLNSHGASSPFMRLVEGEERWEASDHHRGVLPPNWRGTEKSNLSQTLAKLFPSLRDGNDDNNNQEGYRNLKLTEKNN
ncbi:hypothetical protein TNCV_120081 [Trichonephila clavipes]|nr:hypothetical protein TNCV_120081 [Trichonephila clavipes]